VKTTFEEAMNANLTRADKAMGHTPIAPEARSADQARKSKAVS